MIGPQTEKLAYSIPQLCEAMGVSRSTAYLLIASGELPIRKIRRRTVVLREDAVAYLKTLAVANQPNTAAAADAFRV